MQSVGVHVDVSEEVVDFISNNCDGDARVALNALEIAAVTAAARLQQGMELDLHTNEECKDDVAAAAAVVVSVADAKEALHCTSL